MAPIKILVKCLKIVAYDQSLINTRDMSFIKILTGDNSCCVPPKKMFCLHMHCACVIYREPGNSSKVSTFKYLQK